MGEVDAVCEARITVGERTADSLLQYSFWPGKVYARAWNFERKDNRNSQAGAVLIEQSRDLEEAASLDATYCQ